MKVAYWLVGILLGVPVLILLVTYGASELGGEVVTLDRAEPNGEVSQVRVWIVDKDGSAWIEHGASDSHWMSQLNQSPTVVVQRDGKAVRYQGSLDPEAHALYHKLRRDKYGWADQTIELMGAGSAASCVGIPVRLEPAS